MSCRGRCGGTAVFRPIARFRPDKCLYDQMDRIGSTAKTAGTPRPTPGGLAHRIRVTWLSGALVAASGVLGLEAQEVVDLPAEDLPLSGDYELVYRIGSARAGSEWEQFTAIQRAGIGFDGAGNLYLLDAPGPETGARIVIVDPAGQLVMEFGRYGDGPGEFRWPRRMVVWADGGTLVEDVLRMGNHVFGPGGDFDHMARGAVGLNPRPDPVDARAVVGRDNNDGRSLIRFDLSSDEVGQRTLVEAWVPWPAEESRGDPETLEEFVGEAWGFEPALLFDILPSGGIAFSDSSAYAIKLTDRAGMISRVLRRPMAPLPATGAVRQRERERLIGEVRNRKVTSSGDASEETAEMAALTQALADARAAAAENMRFFPEVPVIAALRATPRGTLWIQRSMEPGADEPGPIDVISRDGSYVGTLAPGQPNMPDAFGPDGLVAFIETDEFDVPIITVRRIPNAMR